MLLTTKELAERVGTNTKRIAYLVRTGQIPEGNRGCCGMAWTESQAEQIGKWLKMRKRLTFKEAEA